MDIVLNFFRVSLKLVEAHLHTTVHRSVAEGPLQGFHRRNFTPRGFHSPLDFEEHRGLTLWGEGLHIPVAPSFNVRQMLGEFVDHEDHGFVLIGVEFFPPECPVLECLGVLGHTTKHGEEVLPLEVFGVFSGDQIFAHLVNIRYKGGGERHAGGLLERTYDGIVLRDRSVLHCGEVLDNGLRVVVRHQLPHGRISALDLLVESHDLWHVVRGNKPLLYAARDSLVEAEFIDGLLVDVESIIHLLGGSVRRHNGELHYGPCECV